MFDQSLVYIGCVLEISVGSLTVLRDFLQNIGHADLLHARILHVHVVLSDAYLVRKSLLG